MKVIINRLIVVVASLIACCQIAAGQSTCTNSAGASLSPAPFYQRVEGPRDDLFTSPLGTVSSSYLIAYPKGHSRRPAGTTDDVTYIQGLIDALSGEGAIYFYKGEYRVSNIKLRNGLTLVGQSGTKFSGTTLPLSGWSSHGTNIWSVPYAGIRSMFNTLSKSGVYTYRCEDRSSSSCLVVQDLFMNEKWLNHVSSAAMLDEPDEWFFDSAQGLLLLFSALNPNELNARFELSVYDRAFFYDPNNTKVSSHLFKDVNIHNIDFYGYNYQALVTGDNWVIKNCSFRNMHLSGINVKGDSAFIKQNVFINNGCTGVTCNEDRSSELRENEIAFNNKARYDPVWHAGGLKASGSIGLSLAGNYVHDNYHVGLWIDNFCVNARVSANLLENNTTGIQYEASSSGKITNNILLQNTSYAIYTMCSPDLEISYNTIDGTKNGILIRQDSRGISGNCVTNPSISHCKNQVRNIYSHHNRITVYRHDDFVAGLMILNCATSDCGTWQRYFSDAYNIKFDFNHYRYVRLDKTKPLSLDKAFYWSLDPVLLKTLPYNFESWNGVSSYMQDKQSCIEEVTVQAQSNTDVLVDEGEANIVFAFPNPFTDFLMVNIHVEELSALTITFVTPVGNSIQVPPANVQFVDGVLKLRMDSLEPGAYRLVISSRGSQILSTAVIKN